MLQVDGDRPSRRHQLDGSGQLLPTGRRWTLPPGVAVTAPHDDVDEVHVVVFGAVERSLWLGDRRVSVDIVRPGGALGEEQVLTGHATRFDARTLEVTTLRSVPSSELVELFSHHRHLALRWLQLLADRSYDLESRLLELLRPTMSARLALLLCHESRYGEVDLSQFVIARLLGAHRSSINRALAELEAAHLVRPGYRRIEILDREGLWSAAQAGVSG